MSVPSSGFIFRGLDAEACAISKTVLPIFLRIEDLAYMYRGPGGGLGAAWCWCSPSEAPKQQAQKAN